MAQNWGIEQIERVNRCIFIAGIPRSGTTACQKILGEALRVRGAPPTATDADDGVIESFYFESENDPANEEYSRSKLAFLGGRTKYVDMFNYIERVRGINHLKVRPSDMSRIYFEFSRQHYGL
jgi:hypothetical protein